MRREVQHKRRTCAWPNPRKYVYIHDILPGSPPPATNINALKKFDVIVKKRHAYMQEEKNVQKKKKEMEKF